MKKKKLSIIQEFVSLIIGLVALAVCLWVAFLFMFAATLGMYQGKQYNKLKPEKLKMNRLDKEILKDYKNIKNAN